MVFSTVKICVLFSLEFFTSKAFLIDRNVMLLIDFVLSNVLTQKKGKGKRSNLAMSKRESVKGSRGRP